MTSDILSISSWSTNTNQHVLVLNELLVLLLVNMELLLASTCTVDHNAMHSAKSNFHSTSCDSEETSKVVASVGCIQIRIAVSSRSHINIILYGVRRNARMCCDDNGDPVLCRLKQRVAHSRPAVSRGVSQPHCHRRPPSTIMNIARATKVTWCPRSKVSCFVVLNQKLSSYCSCHHIAIS